MNDKHGNGHTRVANVSKAYRPKGAAPTQVLADCSFDIEPGRLTVMMGASGTGKSTVAYLLAGYEKPDEGTIELDGRPVSGPASERIMVFQETALWPWMTVMKNLTFGPLSRGDMSGSVARERAEELLERFGLSAFRDRYPGHLSGGMKRRAEIAQALMNQPKLMILDEPFRGLDEMTRELMQEYYVKLFEENRLTTLFITSELEEAIFLGDRIMILGGAPSRVVKVIEVSLPHPRTFELMETQEYLEIKAEAMEQLYAYSSQVTKTGPLTLGTDFDKSGCV